MRLRAAITSSFLAYFVQIAAGLATVPLFLRAFGVELYGYWGLLLGITTYLSLLNLGVAQSVSSRVSTADHAAEPEAVPRAVQAGVHLYARVGAAAVPIVALGAWFAPWSRWFAIPAGQALGARMAAVAVLVTFVLELPFSVFRAALVGLGELRTERAIAIVAVLSRLTGAWVFATIHPPLWVAVLVLFALNLGQHAACLIALRARVPGLFQRLPRSELADAAAAKMRSSGLYFLLLQIAGAIVWSTDAAIAGHTLGLHDAARISTAWRVMTLVLTVGVLVSPALGPELAQAWSRGDRARAATLGSQAAQLIAGAVLVCALGLMASGEALFGLWLGAARGADMFVGRSAWLTYCAILAVQGVLVIPDAFVMQAGLHRRYAVTTCVEAALKLGLTLALVRSIGLLGMPLATLIARGATTAWVLPEVYARANDASPARWLLGVLRPLVLPTAAFAVCFALGRAAAPRHPVAIVALGVLSGLAFVAVFLTRGIEPALRTRLFAWVGVK